MDTRSPPRSYGGAATRPRTASWDQKRTATRFRISCLERGTTLQLREWCAIERNTVAQTESPLLCPVSGLNVKVFYIESFFFKFKMILLCSRHEPTFPFFIFKNTTVSQYPRVKVCPVYNMVSGVDGKSFSQAANELRTIWNSSVISNQYECMTTPTLLFHPDRCYAHGTPGAIPPLLRHRGLQRQLRLRPERGNFGVVSRGLRELRRALQPRPQREPCSGCVLQRFSEQRGPGAGHGNDT